MEGRPLWVSGPPSPSPSFPPWRRPQQTHIVTLKGPKACKLMFVFIYVCVCVYARYRALAVLSVLVAPESLNLSE